MKNVFFLLLLSLKTTLHAQELYPYTEPASNMPTHSLSLKNTSVFQRNTHDNNIVQRHMPEVMFGLSKKWMLHLSTTLSNMHQPQVIWEGAKVYAKYRFLSNDDVHKHFRMAVFGAAAFSRNHLDHNEINIAMGDQSGLQGGLIATQLWNKLAFSATGSWNEVLNDERWNKIFPNRYAVHAVNYSLSAGYLLAPFQYKDYTQTNINLYAELLGSRNVDFPQEKYYVDFAPSVQAIFNSTAKLNLGYRFQVSGDIYRLSQKNWMVSFEYIFLNALKRKD